MTGQVTLTGPAPAGGTVVTLTSSNVGAATVPAAVTVAAGQTSASFAVGTTAVSASTPVTVTAQCLTVSKTATLTVKPAAAPQYINVGGSAATPFVADTGYSGGSVVKTSQTISASGLTNPAPQAVYQSQRTGNFTYTLSGLSPGANYTLRLHFAELTYSAGGSRLFGATVNGISVLNQYDVFAAAGGRYKAVITQFSVTANSSGQIILQMVNGTAGAAILNGIELH